MIRATLLLMQLYGLHFSRHLRLRLIGSVVAPFTAAYLSYIFLQDEPERLLGAFAGAMTLGIVTHGTNQAIVTMLSDRFMGRLELLRSVAIPVRAYYLANAGLGALESAVFIVVALLLFASLGFWRPSATGFGIALFAAVAAGTTVSSIGAVIASRVNSVAAGETGIFLGVLAVGMLSPIFYELSAVPGGLRWLLYCSPYTHVVEVLRAVIRGAEVSPGELAALGCVTLLCNLAAVRALDWRRNPAL